MEYVLMIGLLLAELGIPFEICDNTFPDLITEFYIPTICDYCISIVFNHSSRSYDMECYIPDEEYKREVVHTFTDLSEREVLEYAILYLAQKSSVLSERVPYTPLPYNDPINLMADIIEEGIANHDSSDTIANRIAEKRLVFDIKKLVDDALKEVTCIGRTG